MADIRAFAAFRPAKGLEDRIAALPYDVYSREEAKIEVASNPLSFLAIDRAETQFPDTVGTYDDCVYRKAKSMLDDAIEKGLFVKDPSPCYYLYEQTMNVEVQLQDTLVKYASAQDLIGASINNEVRGVATPEQIDDNWVFPLTIVSNDAGLMIELSYYCDKLHRIFTINWTKFDASVAPTGTEGIYKPEFVK